LWAKFDTAPVRAALQQAHAGGESIGMTATLVLKL
jgi:hypothetical protein